MILRLSIQIIKLPFKPFEINFRLFLPEKNVKNVIFKTFFFYKENIIVLYIVVSFKNKLNIIYIYEKEMNFFLVF